MIKIIKTIQLKNCLAVQVRLDWSKSGSDKKMLIRTDPDQLQCFFYALAPCTISPMTKWAWFGTSRWKSHCQGGRLWSGSGHCGQWILSPSGDLFHFIVFYLFILYILYLCLVGMVVLNHSPCLLILFVLLIYVHIWRPSIYSLYDSIVASRISLIRGDISTSCAWSWIHTYLTIHQLLVYANRANRVVPVE